MTPSHHSKGPLFKVDSTQRNYADSVKYCKSQGMSIASIHSQAENDAVRKLLKTTSYLGATAAPPPRATTVTGIVRSNEKWTITAGLCRSADPKQNKQHGGFCVRDLKRKSSLEECEADCDQTAGCVATGSYKNNCDLFFASAAKPTGCPDGYKAYKGQTAIDGRYQGLRNNGYPNAQCAMANAATETGQYFTFRKAEWVAVFPSFRTGSTQALKQCRAGAMIWEGDVKYWDASEQRRVHGRRNSGWAANQWAAGDVLVPKGDDCPGNAPKPTFETAKNGEWKWADGTAWDYVNPQNDGLKNTGETHLAFATDSLWHDRGTGADKLGVVCRSKGEARDCLGSPPPSFMVSDRPSNRRTESPN